MWTSGDPPFPIDRLAGILRGEHVPWSALGLAPTHLLETCAAQELIGLLHHQLSRTVAHDDWPTSLRDDLRRLARAIAARELLQHRQIVAALDALAAAGVRPILFKGTALAYSVYAEPIERPRVDTDLLIRHDQIEAARSALAACGYTAALQCDGEFLFRQFALSKTDTFGIEHTFDVHWKISTQTLFADLLTYDELAAQAVAVKLLGPHARAAGPVHALLLACVHPAMHHRNVERLLWVCDVHLLASRLSDAEFDRFADLATAKQVNAVVAHELARARARFGTRVPERVITRLAVPVAEASATYLRAGRRWHHELASNIRALPRWRDRLGLLFDVLVPSSSYMFARYGLRARRVNTLLLPALYLHRGLWGMCKVLTRRK